MAEPTYEVAIIGAGPGGIAAAHLLRQRNIADFVILERDTDFGGTWRDNHYPGLAVDIPTLWYQLSFAPNPNWTRLFAPGPELYQYLRDTARRLGLYPHLQPNSEVVRQEWDDQAAMWRLHIRDKPTVTARFLISSVGGYVNAKSAIDIDGVEDFGGTILRPNAWDDDYDTRGKRVAVIGTGSSGVQIAAALSEQAGRLDVYQRTPAWVLPKVDFDIPPLMRKALRLPGVYPAVNVAGRLAMDLFMIAPIVHLFSRLPDRLLVRAMPLYDAYCRALYRLLLRVTVADPATRRALVPRYGILAKRPVISSSFLPALNNPNTSLITTPIERITPTGIRTTDGVERAVDLIVAATGYELWTDPETYRPATVVGAHGFDLAEYYRAHGLQSYAGTAHPRLPNRWEIVGPLGFVGLAWPDFVETMAAHAVRVIDEARRRGTGVVAVSQSAFNRWNDRMRRHGRVAHLYFTACNPGLSTYFVNSQRDTVYHRPQTITGSRRFAKRSALADYDFSRRPAVDITRLPQELPA
ncbi:flavin-containing monooxygenase [Mycobacterium deserti]|uniref:NAD(P)/FAD-dependent oxidoreductase n=1 Tax=Mycobacterium deserti TaxID=2978347 RepID=A0ABT2MBL5_9MYCO|nr:NAD(P)/FAD-dependent oxidoreductase [Mycobacterium deserti]MCT7659652.1 NAD(P)/FAD-dependent oxidoreductase [Mycobacterium deserti]